MLAVPSKSFRGSVRPPTPIGQALNPAILVASVDLVARLARDPELRTQLRHLLAIEKAGNKPETFVHDVTLLPRHLPLLSRGIESPMSPV
jgi:hypothetical protein